MLIRDSPPRPTISILEISIGIIIEDTSVKFLVVGIGGHSLPALNILHGIQGWCFRADAMVKYDTTQANLWWSGD